MNNESLKNIFKKVTITLSIIVISSFATLFTVKSLKKSSEPSLPSLSQTISSTKYFRAENSYLLYSRGLNFARREVPKNEDSIRVIVSPDLTINEKKIIKEFLNNVNSLFEIANPDYKFEYTEDTNSERRSNIYVTIGNFNKYGEKERSGACSMSVSGSVSRDFGVIGTTTIFVDENRRENSADFQSAFAREFGRSIGFNYISEDDFFKESIMYNEGGYTFFTENDAYLIISLYSKNNYENTLETKQKVNNLLISINKEPSQEN